jgi:hypothetical protein
MKSFNYCLILFTLFIYSLSFAQDIPNSSFENWNQDTPVDWWGIALLQSSQSPYDGDYAVSMQILDNDSGGVVIPVLSVGDSTAGTDVSQRYTNFRGYYKFAPNGSEWFKALIVMNYNNAPVGSGTAQFSATSVWTEFDVPITYTSEDTPDSAFIIITVSDASGSGVIGSYAYVDYVSFEIVNSIGLNSYLPEDFSLHQNYPNPFNPSTTIAFELQRSAEVTLEVYNLTGQKVSTLIKNEQRSAGLHEIDFDARHLPSGIYFYTFSTAGFKSTHKMIYIK